MPTVLSTKRLTPVQKKHLLLSGIGVVDYDAVHIKDLGLRLNSTHIVNAIFTSQNAVMIAKAKQLTVKHAFCVGKNTAKAAQDIAEEILEIAENARALSRIIIENYNSISFDFFCSRQRRDELPEALKKHEIKFQEYHIYESVINPQQFPNQFDAVLCFSPLGVKAYFDNHNFRPPAICIGSTTTQTAQAYTCVHTATKTSIDSVVLKAIKVVKP